MENCIFCKIINGEIPSYTIFEDDLIKIFLDINPSSNGHCLVIPKKHFLDINDIDSEYLSHIFTVVKEMLPILESKLNYDGISLCQNNGFVQDVKHFHLHVIPKYKRNKKANDIIIIFGLTTNFPKRKIF